MTTIIHFLIVCLAAPALGMAACDVFGAWNYGRVMPERIPGALAGGLVAVFFIWFATAPVGLISYLLFGWLARRQMFSAPLWLSCGGIFGIALGWFLGSDAILPIVLTVGSVVGVLTGATLRLLWLRRINPFRETCATEAE